MMATDAQRTGEAAKRALEDATFAQEVLEGKQDYPEVRQAIIQELATANNQQDVQGFAASLSGPQSAQFLQSYIATGPKPGGMSLANLVQRAGLAAAKPW